MVAQTLALYGARVLPDGRIAKGEKELYVRVAIERRRLKFKIAASGNLIASFPTNPESVCAFVEKYWYWEKVQ